MIFVSYVLHNAALNFQSQMALTIKSVTPRSETRSLTIYLSETMSTVTHTIRKFMQHVPWYLKFTVRSQGSQLFPPLQFALPSYSFRLSLPHHVDHPLMNKQGQPASRGCFK